jgi:hypothetical protein
LPGKLNFIAKVSSFLKKNNGKKGEKSKFQFLINHHQKIDWGWMESGVGVSYFLFVEILQFGDLWGNFGKKLYCALLKMETDDVSCILKFS